MAEVDEISWRRKKLEGELLNESAHYLKFARRNYGFSYALRLIIVAGSLAAAICGFLGVPSVTVGFIAVIPAAILFFSSNMKFQDKSNWHYRMSEGLSSFRRELLYELPDPPTAQSIASVSARTREFSAQMSRDWESSFGLETALSKLELPKAPPK